MTYIVGDAASLSNPTPCNQSILFCENELEQPWLWLHSNPTFNGSVCCPFPLIKASSSSRSVPTPRPRSFLLQQRIREVDHDVRLISLICGGCRFPRCDLAGEEGDRWRKPDWGNIDKESRGCRGWCRRCITHQKRVVWWYGCIVSHVGCVGCLSEEVQNRICETEFLRDTGQQVHKVWFQLIRES